MTLTKKDFRCIDYLLGNHLLPMKNIARSKSHWHGVRNRKLIKANLSPFTKQQVKQIYNQIFPNLNRGLQGKMVVIKEQLPSPFTKRDLNKLKADITDYSEITGSGTDWESFKRRELKTNKKVSDNDYLEFKNKKRNEIREKYEPPTEMPF